MLLTSHNLGSRVIQLPFDILHSLVLLFYIQQTSEIISVCPSSNWLHWIWFPPERTCIYKQPSRGVIDKGRTALDTSLRAWSVALPSSYRTWRILNESANLFESPSSSKYRMLDGTFSQLSLFKLNSFCSVCKHLSRSTDACHGFHSSTQLT